ncbi:hypothetical protein [Sphingomonas sp. SORGH_AS_0879]|uniref:hypothetical protein n=1 Tax=Sphingomonas sp. SORGH_AS_0879 TaxID=3041790 RepID=UPI00278525B1|nr:hypothetical protein [Sphingomonas sp. SORGH_AS_0879]MDQ1230237.1 hypothetical protein [Sphingomonas sp. SORGH_AS_0879]
MSWGGPGFVLAMIAMSTIGWVVTTWIRAKHGYSLDNDWGGTVGKTGMADERKVELLTAENQKLVGQVSRLEERIAVLERIATDPAERTAREIDALRDR